VKLPGSETRAIWTLALFAVVQLADGALTAAGVAQFGPRAEANPLIHFAAEEAGLGAALIAAKLFAISCATLLYFQARHLALAVLTLAYVLGAIVPWTIMLAAS
jgi:hypothetical protein